MPYRGGAKNSGVLIVNLGSAEGPSGQGHQEIAMRAHRAQRPCAPARERRTPKPRIREVRLDWVAAQGTSKPTPASALSASEIWARRRPLVGVAPSRRSRGGYGCHQGALRGGRRSRRNYAPCSGWPLPLNAASRMGFVHSGALCNDLRSSAAGDITRPFSISSTSSGSGTVPSAAASALLS